MNCTAAYTGISRPTCRNQRLSAGNHSVIVSPPGCYKKILEVDPGYVKAYIDLGDHYRNLDANDRALQYYQEAVRVLQQVPRDETWKEDAEELGKAVALLKKHDRLVGETSLIEAWCEEALEGLASFQQLRRSTNGSGPL